MDTRESSTSTAPSRHAEPDQPKTAEASANGNGCAERRVYPRAAVAFDVEYGSAHEFTAAYMRNISGGGLFIVTTAPRPLNDVVTVRFALPGAAHSFIVDCQVVWSQLRSTHAFPAGMGVKFLTLTPEEVAMIAGFVNRQLVASESAQGA